MEFWIKKIFKKTDKELDAINRRGMALTEKLGDEVFDKSVLILLEKMIQMDYIEILDFPISK